MTDQRAKAAVQQQVPASERGGDTRDRLIAATVAVITENGLSGLTTRSVAERAGVNPALVHYHFGSVAALRRAAIVQTLEQLAEPFVDSLRTDQPDALAGLQRIVEVTAEINVDQPGSAVMIEAMLQAPHDPELGAQVKDVLHQFRRLLAERLAAGQDSGQVRGDFEPEGAATLMTAMIDGLLMHRLVDPSTDVAAVGRACRQLLEVNR